jgi:hypothetical protein
VSTTPDSPLPPAGEVAPGTGEGGCLCGTPLFFESTRWPGELHITLGSVDPELAAQLQPQAHVHWAARVPWIGAIHDGLPHHEATGSS